MSVNTKNISLAYYGEDCIMYETKKANKRRKKTYLFRNKVFVGRGIDIGSGRDPLNPKTFKKVTVLEPFDIKDGDAQCINKYRKENDYDFVYSSNCLEHLEDPVFAIKNWFSLVKNQGYLVVVVPDEDLYEQGIFPSKYNPKHKWTFTIFKKKTWSPKSINVIDMVRSLDNCKIIKIELVDTHYDYSKKNEDQTLKKAEAFIEIVLQKTKTLKTPA